VNTLEPNIEALNAKKLDMEFLIDPLFRKTSAAFDEGGAKGLLLNHLSVHHVNHGCELVFDSVDAVDGSASSAAADHSCDISDLQGSARSVCICLCASCKVGMPNARRIEILL
jgi:condensin complex subunit 2